MRYFLNIKFIILFYIFCLFLIAVLPINGKESTVNGTYVFKLRLDYLFHILLFLPWMSLILINTSDIKDFGFFKPLMWFALGFALVFITEGMQYFIPYRAFNVKDLISNSTGLIIGLVLYLFLRSKKFQTKNTFKMLNR